MKNISTQKCHGGTISIYQHDAKSTNCTMKFSLFLPPAADKKPVPILFWLSGLTCTEENFTTKAGAYKRAAELGLAIIAPDTSPRGDDVPDEEGFDIGKGAGFYLNATQSPWNKHYRMEDYITIDLPRLIAAQFSNIDLNRAGIFGHSMGGHGALTLFLRHRKLYKSVSAFAPIVAPSKVPWGAKAFSTYLGSDKISWLEYDACHLIEQIGDNSDIPNILVDQGDADSFMVEQLKPELLKDVCAKTKIPLTFRLQNGYDHSYFFIQSFIEDHLNHHAKILEKS
jgi:S-formylglutathione hydrolase